MPTPSPAEAALQVVVDEASEALQCRGLKYYCSTLLAAPRSSIAKHELQDLKCSADFAKVKCG